MQEKAEAAAHRLTESLRQDLLAGRYLPGTRLKEVDLARQFGAGRYTVRAALRELVRSNLLTHEANRGVVVPELSAEWINELFDYRSVIEIGSLRTALRQGADLTAVEKGVAELERLPADAPWAEVTTAHRAVHHAIVDAAGNPRLLAAYSACEDELQFMLAFIEPDHSAEELASVHREVLHGLRSGEQHAVRALSRDLEVTGRQSLLRALRRRHSTRKDSTQ
jgi:DNA-binding GntR family transcriptional regulator